MAKRFTATELWEEDWFLEMPDGYKLFWFYVLAKCDHGGIFRVNVSKFNMTLIDKKKITSNKAIELFNNGKIRVRVLNENRWLIEDFFVFQYGEIMNLNSKVHESIQTLYNQANIDLTSIRGLKDLKDRVKDKDKDKDIYTKNGSKIFGEKFTEDNEFVIMNTGEKQKLGKMQKFRLKENDLKPEEIFKGQIS